MIELRKITDDNFNECIKLEPKEEQKSFVASNICSLAQAYIALTNNECIPMPYAIYDNDIMVGFIMLSYTDADENEPENVVARTLYASLGFMETGKAFDNGELIAKLAL